MNFRHPEEGLLWIYNNRLRKEVINGKACDTAPQRGNVQADP